MTDELDLNTKSIADLLDDMADGGLTAVALTMHCLARIDRLDDRVNAVIEINPEALDIATALDDERQAGRVRPLHGIPILVKDNIDTGDRMTTTAGSLALEGHVAKQDAGVVARLRDAGAVILGKTNLSEWANFRSKRSSSGWSSRGGQTRNPYAADRTPGGSSSGSGVAVAAGFCAAAIGTETDGSIMSPSAMNGVVGIKPSIGLVGRSGIIPISHSQDTAGPIARSVADAARLMNAMVGVDPDDETTADAERRRPADYTASLDDDGLRGARIGVLAELDAFSVDVRRLVVDCVDVMRKAGAEIVDTVRITAADTIRPSEMTVMKTEFKIGLDAYLAGLGPDFPVHCMADLIAFNKANRAKVMPYFPQDLLEESERTGGLDDPDYLEARRTCRRLTRTDGIDRALADYALDAIVAPTTSAPWLIDWVNGDNRSGSTAYLAAVSGYAGITVPAGFLHGLPVGLSFIGGAFSEPALIGLAHAFERATRIRRPPQFARTVLF